MAYNLTLFRDVASRFTIVATRVPRKSRPRERPRVRAFLRVSLWRPFAPQFNYPHGGERHEALIFLHHHGDTPETIWDRAGGRRSFSGPRNLFPGRGRSLTRRVP